MMMMIMRMKSSVCSLDVQKQNINVFVIFEDIYAMYPNSRKKCSYILKVPTILFFLVKISVLLIGKLNITLTSNNLWFVETEMEIISNSYW